MISAKKKIMKTVRPVDINGDLDVMRFQKKMVLSIVLIYSSYVLSATGNLHLFYCLLIAAFTMPIIILNAHELLHAIDRPKKAWLISRIIPIPFSFHIDLHAFKFLHMLHHKYTCGKEDPAMFFVSTSVTKSFFASAIAPEVELIDYLKREKPGRFFLLVIFTKLASYVALASINWSFFLVYFVLNRKIIGVVGVIFFRMNHIKGGRTGTFQLHLHPAFLKFLIMIFGKEFMYVISMHNVHHAHPRARGLNFKSVIERAKGPEHLNLDF